MNSRVGTAVVVMAILLAAFRQDVGSKSSPSLALVDVPSIGFFRVPVHKSSATWTASTLNTNDETAKGQAWRFAPAIARIQEWRDSARPGIPAPRKLSALG